MDHDNKPYGSARDLPSIQEMERLLLVMRPVSFLTSMENRSRFREMDAELKGLVRTIDCFYDKLGDRNWIAHDDLNLTMMNEVIKKETPEQAEDVLIEWYQSPDNLRILTRKLRFQRGMIDRRHLVDMAEKDYFEGRYYAAVMSIFAVMDGFVNDMDPNGKGLHARDAHEMNAWDSVVGHHRGLSHVFATYSRSFRKTVTEEVFELYRHGIVHGMVPNFDNVVVATKAWNMLFAVVDWAQSLERQAQPVEPDPTWRATYDGLVQLGKDKKALATFVPYMCAHGTQEYLYEPVAFVAEAFLHFWQRRQYGRMAPLLSSGMLPANPSAAPLGARSNFGSWNLEDFEIECVHRPATAAAEVDIRATLNGESQNLRMRWIREHRLKGRTSVNEDESDWKLWVGSPNAMIARRRNATEMN